MNLIASYNFDTDVFHVYHVLHKQMSVCGNKITKIKKYFFQAVYSPCYITRDE